MFELPRLFHVSHVVDDLDAAVAWYDEVFAPRQLARHPEPELQERRHAAVDDEKEFQATLTKLIGLANANPKKREFQGATIYDFDIPDLPNANGAKVQFKGPVSLTVAKHAPMVVVDSAR